MDEQDLKVECDSSRDSDERSAKVNQRLGSIIADCSFRQLSYVNYGQEREQLFPSNGNRIVTKPYFENVVKCHALWHSSSSQS